ncbi:hypothetical protein JCGZ_04668 [Jatropha curcas]|uniref:Mediator of RNA polymerase II transcription subunit 19 n=1 Tax=Jatropha curcas TaxID=180498 RepID=A0A067L0K0_JATCU|nr:hypothetical protein JCGZ_04668 [Jatropha curcas]
MDLEGKTFGRGQRELGGAVDLVSQYKLWPHHEFFCKRSLPLSISETRYLQNVVGDTEIRKGEGMELDQLFHNTPNLRERNVHARILPFDLGVLREAFQMRESTPVVLPSADKGIPTPVMKASSKSTKDKTKKHRKPKDKNKDKDHKKHKHRNKDGSNNKDRKRSGIEPGLESLKKQHNKRRRQNGL